MGVRDGPARVPDPRAGAPCVEGDARFCPRHGVPALAKVCGRTTLRFANADVLPFDFGNLQQTISKYVTEVINMTDDLRESTAMDNKLIKEKYYSIADNTTASLLPPVEKDEVPFLNFSSLQNAVTALEKMANELKIAKEKGIAVEKRNEFNKKLYHAEQSLLTTGLPRRGWYRHSIYAPGYYTGYGVKTLPGVREAIEQRNWKEAQEQIEITAAAINNLAVYLSESVKAL